MLSLLSVNVGMPRDVPWQGRTVHAGIWKYPVAGRGWRAGSTSTATARVMAK
jgi:hypothetical protein